MLQVKKRCPWCEQASDYMAYHDTRWGVPEFDSQKLFAQLILEGQQAGLSWITILRKENNYLQAFFNLEPERLAALKGEQRQAYIQQQLSNSGIIRHALKIQTIFNNADAYMRLVEEGVEFSDFIWSFVNHRPQQNNWQTLAEVPTQSAISQALAKRLKQQGFRFVGPTIAYAFMQAVGMVDDHLVGCFRHGKEQSKRQTGAS